MNKSGSEGAAGGQAGQRQRQQEEEKAAAEEAAEAEEEEEEAGLVCASVHRQRQQDAQEFLAALLDRLSRAPELALDEPSDDGHRTEGGGAAGCRLMPPPAPRRWRGCAAQPLSCY
eukprot:COSAG01_NODE_1241_length_11085_cov_9.712361_27_plen_116_part_00